MLRVEALYKAFAALQVTNGVSLHLPAGRRHAVIGPNGAGKTTLFHLITGEVRPDRGRVHIAGTDATRMAPERRVKLGLARSFQRNDLFPSLSVRENLELALLQAEGLAHRVLRPARAYGALIEKGEALALKVGLAEQLDQRVADLPYGSQRQLEIGLALALAPRLLLLDEPTAGMSPEETRRMLALIHDLPADLAILIIEHDMAIVFDVAERISVLNYGEVILEGTPEEVRASREVRASYLGERRNRA